MSDKKGSVLIVGGGIGGMQAALDLAEGGFKIHMTTTDTSIGGIMSMLDKTFPTGDCAMCMISPKMVDVGRHPNIEIHTRAELKSLSGGPGNFSAGILKKTRYLDVSRCTGCSSCVEKCPVEMPSEYDQALAKRKAISRRYAQAVPGGMAIDKSGVSPCRLECPAEVNAHAYVALTAKGRYREALEVVRRTNPFPASIGRVCTHPCETACTRNNLDQPVQICYLKRFLTDWECENGGFQAPTLPAEKLEKVAVIGSGPAGMTCARDLALKGYDVTVFEKLPRPGGMLRVSIPEYRLPKDVVQREIDQICSLGVKLELNRELGKDFTLDSLKRDGFKAVFVALGTHKALKLGIPGEDDFEGVWDCIEFLRRVNLGESIDLKGKKVIVVGGGNAAIDSARTSLRLGADVTIAYRRTHKEMPANSWEIEEAEAEGVKIQTLAAPVRVTGNGGKVTGVELQKMELGEPDKSGRRRPVPVPDSNFTADGDVVIAAISQEPDVACFQDSGITLNKWKCVETDPVTLATGIEGVFAGGDVASGPTTVVNAIGMGRAGAESIHRYLRGLDLRADRAGLKGREPAVKDTEGVRKSDKTPMPQIPIPERHRNFREVELGFSEEAARAEAERCLNCAGCCECFLCVEACEIKAIDHLAAAEENLNLEVGAVILAPGLEPYNPSVRGELGFGRWPNVVTSLQFERILSASGPYQGKVSRPSDGRHPHKIAWVQCVGSRDSHNANPWCSSVCCMYATKQAVIAREHDKSISPTILYMEMRAFGKDFDKYVDRAKNEYGVRYQRAMISQVREEAGTGNLIVRYAQENGELIDETFDLLVLSVGLEPHANAKELAQVAGIELTERLFPKTSSLAPVETTREGVYATGIYQSPKDIPETVMQGSAVAGRAMALLAEARGTETILREFPPERDITGEEPRLGVFVCNCGINISGTIDTKAVTEEMSHEPNVEHCENLLYACSQDSQEKIKKLVAEKGLNRVLVASCTPRTHTPLFQETLRDAGLNKYLFELADIREQCSWCHMGRRETATAKAKDIVKMNIAKVRLLEPIHTESVPVTPAAMVIGGGVAGMTTALALADQGFTAHIVELTDRLGGLAATVRRTLEGADVQEFVRSQIERVMNHPKVQVHLATKVKKTDGYIGNFETILENGDAFKHGVIVVTTGGVDYQPTEYLYGQNEKVMTQRGLEGMIAEGLPPGKTFAMIQCVGSREEPQNYCSRVCCQDAIKNAIAIRQADPTSRVVIFYRDVRTYGLREDYYTKARELGVLFVRYEVDQKPTVTANGPFVRIETHDFLLDRRIGVNADYLALSVGLRPHPTTEDTGKMYKITRNPDGWFLEAHVKLRPVDFPSEGLFLAGLAHAPKNLDETINQALAAAGRAGVVLSHDRLSVSGIISKHNRDICMSCLSCFRICPFDSPFIDEDGKVSHNEVKCQGCGLCAGICPAKAFQVNSFRDEQIAAMIDSATERNCR